MEIKDFIEKMAEQFDETAASDFTPETEFRQLDDWSSLVALSLIAMIDEEYDVVIKSDDIKASKTVQDLFDIVNSRK